MEPLNVKCSVCPVTVRIVAHDFLQGVNDPVIHYQFTDKLRDKRLSESEIYEKERGKSICGSGDVLRPTCKQLINAGEDDREQSQQFRICKEVLDPRRPFHVPAVDEGEGHCKRRGGVRKREPGKPGVIGEIVLR